MPIETTIMEEGTEYLTVHLHHVPREGEYVFVYDEEGRYIIRQVHSVRWLMPPPGLTDRVPTVELEVGENED